MPRAVTLHFMGRVYELKADEPDTDVPEVVTYVEQIMAEIEEMHSGLPPHKIMVLAALHMGRDYIRQREKNRELSAALENASLRLSSKIDKVLNS